MIKLLKENRKVNTIIFTILTLSCLGAIFFQIAYLKSTFVCGRIIGKSQVKGVTYVEYSFVVNKKTYINSIANYDLKEGITIDSLEKAKCVQIEYSFISESINRFGDKRFLGKSE